MLQKVPGVMRVVMVGDGGVEFETTPGQDTRPEVARTVISGGYDLLEMRAVGLSLEEIFLELTRDEPSPPEMADKEAIILEEAVGSEDNEE